MFRVFQRMKEKGIKIEMISIVVLVSMLIMCGIVLYSSMNLRSECYELIEADEIYYLNERNGQDMQEGSDNLTYQVQHFAQTGDIQYLKAYFEEAASGRREQAVKDMQAEAEEESSLRLAKEKSDELMQLEYHIMKLVVLAYDIQDESVPDVVIGYPLSGDEIGLEAEAMKTRAVELAYGAEYHRLKDAVDQNVNKFVSSVLGRQNQIVEHSKQSVSAFLRGQMVIIAVMILILCVTAVLLYTQVTTVLKQYVQCIEENIPIKEKGVYELRFLASVYNCTREKRDETENLLRHRAECDSLTGMINRGAFENIVGNILREGEDEGCLLLIDVDRFKDINDTYGHNIGDDILKSVGETLVSGFRRRDYVGRMGGDEFGVWLLELSKANTDYVRKRIASINDKLMHPKNGLPPVSISVGVAFSEGPENFKSLYRKADQMLYRVKEGGRCGCEVY